MMPNLPKDEGYMPLFMNKMYNEITNQFKQPQMPGMDPLGELSKFSMMPQTRDD